MVMISESFKQRATTQMKLPEVVVELTPKALTQLKSFFKGGKKIMGIFKSLIL